MPYRDFAAEAAERARAYEPIVFTLPGSDTEFRAVGSMPLGALQDLIAAPDPPELTPEQIAALTPAQTLEITAQVKESLEALRRFFRVCVVDEQHADLDEAVNATDPLTLREAASWLTSEYGARPTKPSSPSSRGLPADGEPSTSKPDEAALVPSLP